MHHLRARARGVLAVCAIAATATLVGVAPATATFAGKGAPQAPAPMPTEHCTQRAAHRPHDEWATCIGVRAEATRAPALGDDTTINVTVTSDVARDAASLRVDLPTGLRFVNAAGASVAAARSLDGIATVSRASLRTSFAAGATHHYQFVVHADHTGAMQVPVAVLAPAGAGRIDGAHDDVFLTVGATAASSHLGAAPAPTTSGTAAVNGGPALAAPQPQRHDLATPGGPRPSRDEAARSGLNAPAGQSCAVGGWVYVDNNTVTRSATNETVQAWDHDTFSGDDLLAVGVIGFDGRYRLCFANDDGDPFDDSTQEVYVRFLTTNTQWRVRDTPGGNNTYTFGTGTVDVCDTCEHDFGNLQPSDGTLMRGLHAFDAMNDLWLFVHGSNQCFDRNDGTCRQMVANWTSTSTDGTFYSRDGNDIHLAADDPNSPTTIVHESSHALMDDVDEDAMPASPNCNPHSIPGVTSQGCAWVEGFAEWLPARVYNDPFFRWPDGSSLNLENPTWGTTGWGNGDSVEGRVAGAMIDISDTSNESFWDFAGEGTGNQYTTFVNTIPNNFNEFATIDRPAQGFEFSDGLSRASTYQNTIDYDFRDPLASSVEKVRPTPNPAQNYGLNTTRNYWSVIGIRPPLGTDDDLNVYDNRNLTGLLSSSAFGSNTIDWVAIDGNRRSPGDYYPRVNQYAGTGNYGIEYYEGSTTVTDGFHAPSFGVNDVVRTEDTFLNQSVPTYFRIVPSGGLDIEAFLVRSTDAQPASFVTSRTGAAAISNGGGFGGEEAFSYTESASQWDGLIVTNKGGSGSYTVFRDTTAPTGSVLIGAGDPPRTQLRHVTLQTAATDGQTGVYQMRVAVDGVLDTEPWQAYATTLPVILPAGDGTKTVAVQYRNNALQQSAVYTDTIVLDTRANLVVTSVTNPPGTAARGASFNITDTTRNSGRTATSINTVNRYYLSTNTTKGSGDRRLGGSRTVPPLAIGASNSATVSVTVPSNAVHGVYYVLACADDTALVSEYAESDNCRASATTVTVLAPDLVVSSLSNPPASAARGTSFTTTSSTKNQGTQATTVTTQTRFFLSTDTTWQSTDTRVGSRNIGALAAGGTNTGNTTLAVPSGQTVGLYYVIACADNTSLVNEDNETNNCRVTGTRVSVT
jgi:hypothetical protein